MAEPMKRVVIESPYAGDVERNLRYLRACMFDCLQRGEAPFASHGLYTQPGVLDDQVPYERDLGIAAGFAWRAVAELTVVYTDLGISRGMEAGMADARSNGRAVEVRQLGEAWDDEPPIALASSSGQVPCGVCDSCMEQAMRDNTARDRLPAFVGTVDELAAHINALDAVERIRLGAATRTLTPPHRITCATCGHAVAEHLAHSGCHCGCVG